MSGIRLSLCIATFNRAAFIGETLDCLTAQLEPSVEIVVLDGGSRDSTEELVSGYCMRHPQVRYIRQPTNGGVDRDFDLAVMNARGEFCWLMSDDDLIKPGAISAVLERLSVVASDLVIVNAEVCSADFSGIIDDQRLRVESDRVYSPTDLDRLFSEAGLYLSFIGCVVIRRATWLEREREPYYGSLFIHIGVIFQKPLPGGAYVMSFPWIRIRYGNANWKPREFEVWMVRWPSLINSLVQLSPDARKWANPGPSIRLAFRLFMLRAKGAYTLREFARWIRPQAHHLWFRVLAWAVAATPGVMVNLAARVIFVWKEARGLQGLGVEVFDLKSSRFSPRAILHRKGEAG